ncbi:MAG: CHRD domain-containing protein [Candidatus Limnocylindria bacterium]
MRRLWSVLAAALLAAACGSPAQTVASPSAVRTTSAPTAAPTQPTSVTVKADCLPANEIPPITNAEATGTGSFTGTFTLTRDTAGKITAATLKYDFSIKGFPATTQIAASHIHEGDAKTNGPVKVNSGITKDNAPPSGGLATFTKPDVSVDAAMADSIITNPAGWYFNVHSAINAGGFCRGQLQKG